MGIGRLPLLTALVVGVTAIDAVQSTSVRLSGRVVDAADQRPMSDAAVYLSGMPTRPWPAHAQDDTGHWIVGRVIDGATGVLRAVSTGPDGRFHFAGLPPGEYFAAAKVSPAPDRWSEVGALERLASRAVRLTLSAAPVSLELNATQLP